MYRLALDLGTNSIGWFLFFLDEHLAVQGIICAGVRIFSDGRDPQSGASLAADRRLARQARRRRDRFIGRRNRLLQALVACGLMPQSETERKRLQDKDPYALRAQALDHALPLYDLGRALFHINQRRGFKSNRKTDKTADEKGVVKSGIQRLYQRLAEAGARTLGEYLHGCKKSGNPTRVRAEGAGAALHYPFYPDRSLLEREFDLIRDVQAPRQAQVSPEHWDELRRIIFHQRPLQDVPPGHCSLDPSQFRAPVALPLAQKVRILQDLNHLRILTPDFKEEKLTLAQRDIALGQLLTGADLTFAGLRKLTGLGGEYTFNLENSAQNKIAGDLTAKKLGAKGAFGSAWAGFDLETKSRIVDLLLTEEDEETLQAVFVSEFSLTEENARKAVNAALPEGYTAHCRSALQRLAEVMEKGVISYAEARVAAGYPYKEPTGEILPYLPYYGVVLARYVGKTGNAGDTLEKRYGRIANPTVHVALNQLRRLTNELIKEHGLPAQIVMEVARDLKNGLKAREEIALRQRAERKLNDDRRAKLEESGIAVSPESMLRLRLWEELAKDSAASHCVYTGEPISFSRLFGADVEIEHILPVARTLDDSSANKTVSLRRANRDKGNQSPFEAFHDRPGYDWTEIANRAANLPQNKKWRFAEDAMAAFEENEGFLARHLTDTRYIAKVAREYLCSICAPNQVWVTPGRLTSHLAKCWGFPRKNRNYHRHHALDAAVIGVTERGLLQRAAHHSARAGQKGEQRFLADFPEPWPGFRGEVLKKVEGIIISHKSDHGIEAALHDAPAYGILAPNGRPKNAQHRKSVGAFKKVENLLDIKEIKLRAELLRDVSQKPHAECLTFLQRAEGMKPREAAKAMQNFADLPEKEFIRKFLEAVQPRGIRGIRIVETETLIPIRNKEGTAYKGVVGSSNAWYDIYRDASGKWVSDVVSTFDAHRKDFTSPCAARGLTHIMRLFKNDMLELESDEVKKYYYVLKFAQNGQISLVEHMEANADKRNSDKKDPFKFWSPRAGTLQKMKAKAIFVTPAGKIIYREKPCHAAAPSGNKRE